MNATDTLPKARVTKKGDKVRALLSAHGWERTEGVARPTHASYRAYIIREEEHPYIFTKGEWTLTLEDNAAGAIIDGKLRRGAQLFMLKSRRSAPSTALIIEVVTGRTDTATLISLVAENPDLMAWLTAEFMENLRAQRLRDRATGDSARALQNMAPAVTDPDAYQRAARDVAREVSEVATRGRVLGDTDTVAQVAALKKAVAVMESLLDPEANAARQAEVAEVRRLQRA